MKNILPSLHHRRLQRSLVLYVDNELPQDELAQMHRHVEQCAECREKLAEVRACRELLKAGKTSLLIPTEQLWQRLVRSTSVSSQHERVFGAIRQAAGWRYLRWSIVTAALLLFGVAVWKKTSEGEHATVDHAAQSFSSTAIDYSIFLDGLRHEDAAADFYKRYPAQVVELAEAQQAIAFPLASVEALPESFRLECVRVLECNGKKCIQFTCSKADKVVNIFQHGLGQSWTLGQYAVARAPICKVECLLVNAKNLKAVSWQGNHSEYLAVGDLNPQELEQVVRTLR